MTQNQINYQKSLAEIALNKQKAEQQRLQNVDTELANAVSHYGKYGIDMEPVRKKYDAHYGSMWMKSMADLSHDNLSGLWDVIAPISKLAK